MRDLHSGLQEKLCFTKVNERLRKGNKNLFQIMKLRKDIQALRGIAVLAVVLFHTESDFFPQGYLGVDVFFVISGFVVTPMILKIFLGEKKLKIHLENLLHFYKRRFFRLAPALAACLIFALVSVFLVGSPGDHERFSLQGLATIFLIGNLGAYKFSGDYFSLTPNPLVHTWSLSVEEQIYICLPIFLLLFLYNRVRIKRITFFIFILLFLLSLFSFLFPAILKPIYNFAGLQIVSQISFYSPFDRLWQFILGGLGFLLSDKFSDHVYSFSKKFNFFVICIAIVALFIPLVIESELGSVLVSSLTAFILIFRVFLDLPKFLIKNFEWLGNRSYSIYLIHMPILYLARYSPLTAVGNDKSRFMQSVFGFIISIVLGSICFSLIENRFRGLGKTKLIRKKLMLNTVLLSTFLPFLLYFFMYLGISNQYWGLNKNEPQPAYAGFLDSNCERDTLYGPPCEYFHGDSVNTVVLIGDSHAGMISQAFVNAAKENSLNAIVWTHSSCRFQLVPDRDLSSSCVKINKDIINFVSTYKPTAIVLSQSITNKHNLEPLKNAITELKNYSSNISIVGATPVFPDSPRFMVQTPVFASLYDAPKKFKISEMEEYPSDISKKMKNWAGKNSIDFISLNSAFCDGTYCNRWSPQGWLYRDTDHFSVIGGELATPYLSEWFLKLKIQQTNKD